MTIEPQIPSTPGIARRLAAMIYDSLLIAALWFAIDALLLLITHGQLASPDRPLWQLYLLQACLIFITVLFFAGFWTHGGQTLGMRAWRLRLVTIDNQPINWQQSLKRLAIAIPSIGACGLGFLWMLLDREHLALHDRLSGTKLILK